MADPDSTPAAGPAANPDDNLRRLADTGRLKAEPPARDEVAGLLAQARTALADAASAGLSVQGRFLLGYAAAHALGLAALRARGWRPGRGEGHRAVVFQTLPLTVAAPPELWVPLNKAHRKRNDLEYNALAAFSEGEVTALLRLAGELDARLRAMLAAELPHLLKDDHA